MQFVFLLNIQEILANLDYEGNKVDLPSRSFGTATMKIWAQIEASGHPGNRKLIKPKNTDDTTAELKIFLRKNNCRLYGGVTKFGGYSILIEQNDDEIKEKKRFSVMPKFYYQPFGQ